MSELVTGRIGELIVALRLEEIGVSTSMCPVGAFDIIASYNGKIYRIQVKARTKPDPSRPTHYMWATAKGGKKSPLDTSDCDIVALVSVPHENVFFMPVVRTMNVTKRLRVNLFEDRGIAPATWTRAIIDLENFVNS